MLQDLDREQVKDFIIRWHDQTYKDPSDRSRKRDCLQKAISESPAIRELAGNPLLLTMMAILNRNQELPRDRAELYNQSSRLLLHQWDVDRTLVDEKLDPTTINYRDKQAMLRAAAGKMIRIRCPLSKSALRRMITSLSAIRQFKNSHVAGKMSHGYLIFWRIAR